MQFQSTNSCFEVIYKVVSLFENFKQNVTEKLSSQKMDTLFLCRLLERRCRLIELCTPVVDDILGIEQ